jgi:raffinose/stachyose/melibiose transport system substrate-binding protein
MISKMRIMSILLIILVSFSAFATGAAQSNTSGGQITLRVLYYLEATAPNAISDADLWFNTFMQQHPNVRIERENLFSEPYHDKMRAYAAAGDLPDVLYVWPSGRSDYLHDQKLLKDLTPFINKDGIKGKFLPLTMDPAQQQAGYMAMIPQGLTSTHALFTNMEVLNDCGLQPAKTYSELKAQVPVLRAKGYETIIMAAKDEWVMQSCLFSMLAGRFCGTGWEKRILSGQAKFTDPDFVAALNFVKTLYDDGVIQRSAVGIEYGEGPGLFANKKSAYYIDGDWRTGAFITDSSTGQALLSPARQNNIRIGVFPDIEGAKINKSSSSIVGVGYAMSAAIPAGSAKEALAWELVKWLTGKEVSQLRTEHGGTPTPSRTDLDYNAMKLEPIQKTIANLGNEVTTATVVIDGVFASDVYNPINTGLIEIAMGTRTPQQVAADVQRAYDTWKANNR